MQIGTADGTNFHFYSHFTGARVRRLYISLNQRRCLDPADLSPRTIALKEQGYLQLPGDTVEQASRTSKVYLAVPCPLSYTLISSLGVMGRLADLR